MNILEEIDFKYLIEVDTNPLIIFNNEGKILYLNSSAEILMGYVNSKEIFNLALNNASKDYGSRTTQIELSYMQLNFYAINVSYLNEEWIAIRLYYRPLSKKISKKNRTKEVLTDINKLLDIALLQFKIESDTEIRVFTDQDIPKTMLNQNSFSKLLRKTLYSFKASKYLDITLKLGIGEHIIIDDRPYPLIDLKFESNGRYTSEDKSIKELCNELFLVSNLSENSILFEIPLIKS
jgi:hypothetical protein